MPRCVVVVLDSAGIGALPDAERFGDVAGANTLANAAAAVGGLALPNLGRLGLGSIATLRGVDATAAPVAHVGRLEERSAGKDTITGHWEMTGVVTVEPFPTYPEGFPPDVVAAFARICGCEPIGNRAGSGTDIVAALGPAHVASGRPILYTSADSVFQVAAHERVVPLATLHAWCAAAREMLVPPHRVNRVIARPFDGEPGAFTRTANRRDYAVAAPPNVLDTLEARGVRTHAVGKISDIFSGRGIATSTLVVDDDEAMFRAIELLRSVDDGLVFANLNDFDSKYGHRRDARGYATALERFDAAIPALEAALRPGDLAILTADHGCDPTAPGSDHTREYVPYVELGRRRGIAADVEGFSIVGDRLLATLCERA